MDNKKDRKIDVTAILVLLVQNRQQLHMTEPRLDQALMDSAYRCGAFLVYKKQWINLQKYTLFESENNGIFHIFDQITD